MAFTGRVIVLDDTFTDTTLPTIELPTTWNVWTSDSFNDGVVSGRVSDAALGGTAQGWITTWAKKTSISEGALQFIVTDQASLSLSPGPDVEVSFTLTKLPSLNKGLFLRVRQASATESGITGGPLMRILGTSTAASLSIIDGSPSVYTGSITVTAGQTVTIRAFGTTITVLVNGAEVLTLETATVSGNIIHLLSYYTDAAIDDLVIRVPE